METHESVVLPITLGAAGDFQTSLVNFLIVDPMLPYEAILTGGAPGHSGAVTTMLITDSRASIGVCCLDVLLDFVSPWVRGSRQLVEMLSVPLVVGAATTQSTLECVVIVIWTVTPSTKHDGDGDHNPDFMTTQMHCHHHIDGGTSYTHSGPRAKPLHLHRSRSMTVGSPQLRESHTSARL
jgi:hypothetical protein